VAINRLSTMYPINIMLIPELKKAVNFPEKIRAAMEMVKKVCIKPIKMPPKKIDSHEE
jgi:hypothetical protein